MAFGTSRRAAIFGVACALMAVSCAAWAEDAPPPGATANPNSAAPKEKQPQKKPEKKSGEAAQGSKSSSSHAEPKRSQFRSEAEAKASCRGGVVWVDKDHFNHYPGSREYGVQPGAFACEN